jgi:hypothetical protein
MSVEVEVGQEWRRRLVLREDGGLWQGPNGRVEEVRVHKNGETWITWLSEPYTKSDTMGSEPLEWFLKRFDLLVREPRKRRKETTK